MDKKIEQELWNLGFKNYIDMLQCQAKDRQNPKRSESQVMLSWCLEAASGFYLTLLQEICTAFDLDLPFYRKGYVYGCISSWEAIENISKPQKSSCYYACQYCLVHLGDIARYRNQYKQAELFYRHAVSLSPSSGQPYNQLALLAASRGNKLGTVFNYVRSVAVKHPFPVATVNLSKTLSSALNDNSISINENTKLTSHEYIIVFLKFHGILHNSDDIDNAKNYMKLLTETLTSLVATESFTSWRLIQMIIINIYAIHHTAGKPSESSMDLLKIQQLSTEEKLIRNCILDLISGSLSALLLPIYTIKNSHIDYIALPAIKLLFEWIRLQPDILNEISYTSRLQIWPNFCVLLNSLQSYIDDFDYEEFKKIPLPEDRILRGFLPIEKSFETLRFSGTDLGGDTLTINKLRAVRILNIGKYLAEYRVNGTTLINFDDKNMKFSCAFEAFGGPNDELIKELEVLSLNREDRSVTCASPIPSESVSSKESSKIGILKPQGSLERSKDLQQPGSSCVTKNSSSDCNNSLPLARKTRQNIAMQAIMRKAENEQKQVTFKNISPINFVNEANNHDEILKNNKNQEIFLSNEQQKIMSPIIDSQFNRFSAHNFDNKIQTFPIAQQTASKILQPNFHPQLINANAYQQQQQEIKNCTIQNSIDNQKNSQQQYPMSANDMLNMQMRLNNVHGFNQVGTCLNQLNNPSTSVTSNFPFQSQPCELPASSSSSLSSLSSSSSTATSSPSSSLHQQSSSKNSPIFRNYETAEFNVWKDTQPPQPPVNWWNSLNNKPIDKTIPSINENYQNWLHSPIVGPIHVSQENNSSPKPVIDKHFVIDDDDNNIKNNYNDVEQYSKISNNEYSLFNGNSWGNPVQSYSQEQPKIRMNQQSLWSGPGPSPLERLLEQQKSLREGGT